MKSLSVRKDIKFLKRLYIDFAFYDRRRVVAKYINKRDKESRIIKVAKMFNYLIDKQLSSWFVSNWSSILSNTLRCRYCEKPISKDEAVITKGYWLSSWYICHKDCRQEGEKEEAFDCQNIDSDCNDCLHFSRIKGFQGLCLLKNKNVVANANFCSGYDCFVHRKTNFDKL